MPALAGHCKRDPHRPLDAWAAPSQHAVRDPEEHAMTGARRCRWAEADPLLTRCHDTKWGMPVRGDGVAQPASTPLSERVTKALKTRRFRFVGPTIAHAWMQSVGMVDDHAHDCRRRGGAHAGGGGRVGRWLPELGSNQRHAD